MSAPPYMPLYVADYLADTTHLTCEEHGAYLLLLMSMWRAGGRLPTDDARLAKLTRMTAKEWASAKASVLPFFVRRGGHLTHKRLSKERAKYDDKCVRLSEAGKRGAAEKRKKNNGKSLMVASTTLKQPEPEPEPKDRNKSVPILIEGMTENGTRPDVRRTTTNGRRSAWSDAIAERNRSIAGDDEPETGGSGGFGDGGGTRLFVTSARKA